MKKFILALGVAFASASSAQAAEMGGYAGIGAGLHMANKSAFSIQSPPGTQTGGSDANFNLGYGVAASAGYRWSDSLRTELELSYRAAGLDNAGTEEAEGKQTSISAMANILFDVGMGTNFQPYIGAGVGIADNKWRHVKTPTSPVFTDANKRLQWQAIVGVEMPINARTNWFLDYRFIGSSENEYNSISGSPATRIVGVDNLSHNLMLGLRFAFGG